jgi:hypothetical protein
MMKNLQASLEDNAEIPLPVIDSATLKRIVVWLEKW